MLLTICYWVEADALYNPIDSESLSHQD